MVDDQLKARTVGLVDEVVRRAVKPIDVRAEQERRAPVDLLVVERPEHATAQRERLHDACRQLIDDLLTLARGRLLGAGQDVERRTRAQPMPVALVR